MQARPIIILAAALAAAGSVFIDRAPEQSTAATVLLNTSTGAIVEETTNDTAPRSGIAFPINHDSNYRMNLLLVTSDLPQEVWDSGAFQQDINAVDGTFTVSVWQSRAGRTIRAGYITLPTAPLRMVPPWPVPASFKPGDVLIIETHPGLFIHEHTPFASLIDNRNNASTTVWSYEVPVFHETATIRTRPVRH